MMADYDFWMAVRRALLIMVDAIERKLGIKRTAEIRCLEKDTIDKP